MPSLRPILLVAVLSLWSAARVLADNGTACLCTGPQCTLPCPGPPAPDMTPAAATQFPFCPPRPPSIAPFPWAPPSPMTVYRQNPGFLASAACRVRMVAAAWLPVAFVLSAFLVLLQ